MKTENITGSEYLFERIIFGIAGDTQKKAPIIYRVFNEINRDRAGMQPAEYSEFENIPRLNEAVSILEKAGLVEHVGNYVKLTEPYGTAVFDTIYRDGVIDNLEEKLYCPENYKEGRKAYNLN